MIGVRNVVAQFNTHSCHLFISHIVDSDNYVSFLTLFVSVEGLFGKVRGGFLVIVRIVVKGLYHAPGPTG